jgi:hypothetical protein
MLRKVMAAARSRCDAAHLSSEAVSKLTNGGAVAPPQAANIPAAAVVSASSHDNLHVRLKPASWTVCAGLARPAA